MQNVSGARLLADGLPTWISASTRRYVEHTEIGLSLRELARDAGCHPSTVMRQVRRLEQRRDDPLVDAALQTLASQIASESDNAEETAMTAPQRNFPPTPDDDTMAREGRRILRRLQEPGACLAVAPDMDKAVVVRDLPDGTTARIAVLDRTVAEAMALSDWIELKTGGRVLRYAITTVGRAALKRLLADDAIRRVGPSEVNDRYGEQHRDWNEKTISDADGLRRRIRYNSAESPVTILARRLEKNGKPFLGADQVAAGERLREDFEIAQMGPRVAQNWDRFMVGSERAASRANCPIAEGPSAARERVAAALAALGPGLGDVALRCCCFLEGLETAERRMGWSARSGKIVLRIALTQLARHYSGVGDHDRLIG